MTTAILVTTYFLLAVKDIPGMIILIENDCKMSIFFDKCMLLKFCWSEVISST